MRIVDLAGSPGEIGLGHGVALAAEIDAHLHRWKARLADAGVDDVEEWIAELVRDSWYVSTAFTEAPHLVEEVDGISEGAGISMLDAWFLQLMDESWRALDGPPGCTTFGVVNGLRSWSGQTMDLEPFRAGSAAMLRIAPARGAPLLVLTMAGCVGLLGVSAAGFAVLVNALPQVPARRTGLPVALVVRTALAAPNVGAATSFVHDAPHATGQHYLVSGAEQLASFECSPVGVVPGAPRCGPRVAHEPSGGRLRARARRRRVRRPLGGGARRDGGPVVGPGPQPSAARDPSRVPVSRWRRHEHLRRDRDRAVRPLHRGVGHRRSTHPRHLAARPLGVIGARSNPPRDARIARVRSASRRGDGHWAGRSTDRKGMGARQPNWRAARRTAHTAAATVAPRRPE